LLLSSSRLANFADNYFQLSIPVTWDFSMHHTVTITTEGTIISRFQFPFLWDFPMHR
jgi:hypothetical protein